MTSHRIVHVIALVGFLVAIAEPDLYNVFNSNTATTYEAIYDPTNAAAWFQPTAVVQPRFVRFNVQFDF